MPFLLAPLRRFQFRLPQRIAAVMLALFLAQGLWLVAHQELTASDYQYARCGREIWENASPITGYYTSCGNIHDGILTYRAAGLPLTLNYLFEHALDFTRKPEDRIVQTNVPPTNWELRHQLTHVLILLRLPFLLAGCVLGAALWWVTRRLFGNWGGYLALGLYAFTPGILAACVSPNPEIMGALGLYGGFYSCIGVAHSMQGPCKSWRPRLILLVAAFAVAAASHIVLLPLVALFGLLAMFWIAEGKRGEVLPVILLSSFAAVLLLFAAYGFSIQGFSGLLQSGSARLTFSADPLLHLVSSIQDAGITLAAAAALLFFALIRRSQYFGNTTPLLVFSGLILLVTTGTQSQPWIWSMPFLLTFTAGVFADVFEGPRGKFALAAAAVTVSLQAVICILSLPGLAPS